VSANCKLEGNCIKEFICALNPLQNFAEHILIAIQEEDTWEEATVHSVPAHHTNKANHFLSLRGAAAEGFHCTDGATSRRTNRAGTSPPSQQYPVWELQIR